MLEKNRKNTLNSSEAESNPNLENIKKENQNMITICCVIQREKKVTK